MKELNEAKGYIFDMDGVLCDSEPYIAEAAIRMFKERYGVVVTAEDFVPFVGTGEDRYLSGVAAKYDVAITLPEDKHETYRLYFECIVGRMQALPGVLNFISKAEAAGKVLAVATSADRKKFEENVRQIGLDPSRFNAVVTGGEIENKKPAPDIFLKAAERLGLNPVDCVVFEDAKNGVQAAKSAGAHCVGIASFFTVKELIKAGADEAVAGFTEL